VSKFPNSPALKARLNLWGDGSALESRFQRWGTAYQHPWGVAPG
jgi:hypothetical protein